MGLPRRLIIAGKCFQVNLFDVIVLSSAFTPALISLPESSTFQGNWRTPERIPDSLLVNPPGDDSTENVSRFDSHRPRCSHIDCMRRQDDVEKRAVFAARP